MQEFQEYAKSLAGYFKEMVENGDSVESVEYTVNEEIAYIYSDLGIKSKGVRLKVHENSIGQNFLKFDQNLVAFSANEIRVETFLLRFLIANQA